ncbi:MAG: DUF6438 domain-containing protein [Flavobacteriales bacterium]
MDKYFHKFYIAVIVALVAIASCKNKKHEVAVVPVPAPPAMTKPPMPTMDSVLLTYQRTPCFGMCPTFNLTVNQSGLATYEGRNFTDRIGLYQSQWDATALQSVTTMADSIGYFGLDEKYDNEKVTDLPTIHTAILKNGKLKKVANRYKGPKSLQKLYDQLDTLIAHATWKPKRPE